MFKFLQSFKIFTGNYSIYWVGEMAHYCESVCCFKPDGLNLSLETHVRILKCWVYFCNHRTPTIRKGVVCIQDSCQEPIAGLLFWAFSAQAKSETLFQLNWKKGT